MITLAAALIAIAMVTIALESPGATVALFGIAVLLIRFA
jgi:hypothetical protein